jgi:hypothetical protein
VPALVELVRMADNFHASLTLEFTPQWADTFLADPALLALLRGWQAEGHEVAAHHHALSYATGWDGYTNHPPADILFPDMTRGDMQDFLGLLVRMAGDSSLLTGCITDWDADWPAGLVYRTEGHNMSGALTEPEALVLNGQAVTSLGFGLLGSRERLDSAKVAFDAGAAGQVLGIVLHEKNFAEEPTLLRSWLQFLKDRGARVKTVRQILREYEAAAAAKDREPGATPLPAAATLRPAFPNPFNGTAVLTFEARGGARLSLALFDAGGRRVREIAEGNFPAGRHSVRLDAGNLPSGAYVAVLSGPGVRSSAKLLLLR